ncbi:MAG: acyltransferase family protein [Nitrospinales bacterium]
MKIVSQRRHDIDWLRVLGVLLLVPFHAAQIFILDPNSIMYVKDTINSRALTCMAGFIHMWHMPMLFIISGSATYLALGVRSTGQYIRERFLRLFVPLVFGILTYIPLTTYIQRSKTISLSEAYLGFFQMDFAHLDGLNGTFTPAHLWFILYLFIFSVIGLPIFLAMRSERCKSMIENVGKAIPLPLTLLLLGVPLTLAAAMNILGDKNPIYYFLVFFYGFLIASDARFQQGIDKLTWGALAFGIFAAVVQMITLDNYSEWTFAWIAHGLLYEMGRWTLTLAVLGLGHRFLNRTNGFLRYANEAALPFYLLHMTFTVLTGFFVIQIDTPVVIKYPLIIFFATGSTVLVYELVRRWKVTRWLLGMKITK